MNNRKLVTVLVTFDYDNKFVTVWWLATPSCLRISGYQQFKLTLHQSLNLFTCDIFGISDADALRPHPFYFLSILFLSLSEMVWN